MEGLFCALASRGRSVGTQMIDSTHIKAHRSASGGKGGAETGDRPLARRPQHENPAVSDAKGRLLSILLTAGQARDCPPASRLIRPTKPAKTLIADTAYDGGELRQCLEERGTKPVIPNKANRK